MDEVNAATTLYPSQLETGALEPLQRLASMVIRPRTDNHVLQGRTLKLWSENAASMASYRRQTRAHVRGLQLSKIRTLVDNAYKNVPFYHELYSACGYEAGGIRSFSDFEQLPVVDKHILSTFDASMIVNDPEALSSANTSRTSGSSGKPFTVFTDDDDIVLDHLQVMRFYSACLQRPLQEHDWIYVIHHAGLAFSSLHGAYRTFQLPDLLPDTPLGAHLLLLRPRVLVTLPSYLPLILQHKAEVQLSGVEAILTNSESSTQLERAYYAKALGIPVFDEYSSEEIGLIATQCAHGQYHAVEDGVYLEILNADAQGYGNVICTDLNNELMPLIRFDHGDVARKSDAEQCACGDSATTLLEINGRRDDAFRTRERKLVPSASILAAVDDVLITPDRTLDAFRLIQKSATTVELLTHYIGEPHENMDDILHRLGIRLSSLFGYAVTLLHREVDALPEEKSYKRRSIISEWEFT